MSKARKAERRQPGHPVRCGHRDHDSGHRCRRWATPEIVEYSVSRWCDFGQVDGWVAMRLCERHGG